MKKATVLVSVIIHGGLALALFTAQQRRAAGRTHTITVAEAEKKKKVEAPKPPKPQPPKVAKIDTQPKEQKIVAAPKMAPVEAPSAAPKMDMAALGDIAMSNEDIGDAVAIPVVVRQAQAAAPVRVASIDQDPRRRRIGHELGPGPNLDERCSEEPSKPEPVYKTEIEYTAAARSEGIEGKLKLKIIVGADGEVLSVVVMSSVSPELDAAAVASVKQWRFKPAMACGKPVAGGSYILARRFELGD